MSIKSWELNNFNINSKYIVKFTVDSSKVSFFVSWSIWGEPQCYWSGSSDIKRSSWPRVTWVTPEVLQKLKTHFLVVSPEFSNKVYLTLNVSDNCESMDALLFSRWLQSLISRTTMSSSSCAMPLKAARSGDSFYCVP